MCTNMRYIFNRYSRKRVLVKCGKCAACRQERALKRAQRIKNNVTDGTIALFVTLTYANDYLPYIIKDDLVCDYGAYRDINIYRDSDIRYVYDRHSDLVSIKKDLGIRPIGSFPLCDTDISDIDSCKHPNGMSANRIGVCWYPDVQNFYKRLRQILERKYCYEDKFSYFTCSELGSVSQRPHFHSLIFIKRDDETLFKSAITEAWSYADKHRTYKYIEIAKDAANYVASYVNCASYVPTLLQIDYLKPKHSQSKGFGVVLDCFSLRSILKKIDSGDLCYYREQKFDGDTSVSRMPIPLYVLNRYFPKCKGFGWLTSSQLHAILLDPASIGYVLNDFKSIQTKLITPYYSYTPKESYQLYVRLENAFQRFHDETGQSRYDYAYYYERVYPLYNSMLLKMSHENIEMVDDYTDFYENALEVFENPALSPTLNDLPLQTDPNKRKDVVEKTAIFARLHSRIKHQRQVTNFVMDANGHNV